jgi:hypothetical protein
MPPSVETKDAITQQLAMLTFDGIRKEHLHELPDITTFLNHDGQVSDFSTLQLAPGLYIRPDLNVDLRSGRMPDRIGIVPNQLLRIGKEDSQHAVFFGNLAIRLFNKPMARDQTIVAVKPFEGGININRGFQELAISQQLGKTGSIAINPFGLLVGDRTESSRIMFLLSRYVPLGTLDSFDWDKLSMDEINEKVLMVAAALADLHENLVFHGDSVLRNFASLEADDKLYPVDFEYAVSLANLNKSSASQIKLKQKMSADLTSAARDISSLLSKRVKGFSRLNDLEKFEVLLKKFYMPYATNLSSKPYPHAQELRKCYETVVFDHSKQASGEW